MNKFKLMLIVCVFLLVMVICNNCYASSITKEQIKDALEEFSTFSEEKMSNIEVTDSIINFKVDSDEFKINYTISDDKITFESSFDVYKNMKYEEFVKNQEVTSSNLIIYPAILKLKGVEYEESVIYFGMDLLFQAFGNMGESTEQYIIIDDLNLEDGVIINKDKENKYYIYTSEFGERVMEYVTAMYKEKQAYTDEFKTYEMITERINITEDSCKIVSKFIINLNADFSQVKQKGEQLKNNLSGENTEGNNDENNNENNNVKNEEENELPKAGIDFNYTTAFNIILILASVALGGIVLTSFIKKKIKD